MDVSVVFFLVFRSYKQAHRLLFGRLSLNLRSPPSWAPGTRTDTQGALLSLKPRRSLPDSTGAGAEAGGVGPCALRSRSWRVAGPGRRPWDTDASPAPCPPRPLAGARGTLATPVQGGARTRVCTPLPPPSGSRPAATTRLGESDRRGSQCVEPPRPGHTREPPGRRPAAPRGTSPAKTSRSSPGGTKARPTPGGLERNRHLFPEATEFG